MESDEPEFTTALELRESVDGEEEPVDVIEEPEEQPDPEGVNYLAP